MATQKQKQYILYALIGVLILTFAKSDGISLGNSVFLGAIGDDYPRNVKCTDAEDCPDCMDVSTNFTIGYIFCDNPGNETLGGFCDDTYCVNVQPVKEWLKKEPMQFVKNNVLFLFGVIAILILGFVMFGTWKKPKFL